MTDGRGTPTLPTVRIGIVSPYSLSIPGGVQSQVLGLARSLRSLGHHVRVLGPCDGPPPDAGVTPLGNSIPFATNGSVAPIAPDIACALRTMRALRDEDFDVVHLHEPLVPGPCMTTAVVATTPLVGTFHATGASTPYWLSRRPLRWLADHLDDRVAVSVDAQRYAIDHVGGEYHVIPNGIEVERFAKASPEPSDHPTIFFIGRHEPRKGLELLLHAFRRLPADIRLWVAGIGPDTDRLQSEFAGDGRISWLGRIDEGEKARRIRGADVVCAPSTGSESFGVVLLEPMAAGTPVVASDLPGYRRVARDGVEALLVPPGDVDALAAALARVLADGALAETLSIGGSARADDYSMDKVASAYLDRYLALG